MNILKRINKKKSQKSFKNYSIFTVFLLFILCITFWLAESFISVSLPQSDKPASLYANQTKHDLRSTMLAGINEAQKSILLIIYSLTDQQVIQALRNKCEQGVDVTVICDPNASPGASKRLGKKIKTHKRFGKGLMHQKILMVDGVQTWIGSANMTGESLRIHANLITGFHSAELAAVVRTKADSFLLKENEYPLLHQDFNIGGQQVELWFLPDNQNAERKLLKLIHNAEKTIRVAMFTWTRYDFAKAIIAAKDRGVDTEVVIDHHSAKGASAKVVEMLKSGGIPVTVSQGNALLHHKFMYIDGKTLVNGSTNWTKAAFTKNDDCFIILHKLTDEQRSHMDSLWKVISEDSIAPN